MWRVVHEDGSAVDDQNTYWTDLPKDKLIVKASLYLGDAFVNKTLSGFDSYYYAKEAVGIVGSSAAPTLEAEIMGGINLETQTVEEIRFNHRTKELTVCSKPLSQYGYSKEILLPGKK